MPADFAVLALGVNRPAPLALPGSPGFHWYLVPRVGYPDPASFEAARAALAELHDELWASTGIGPERTVLGGFSMGCVVSYALALSAERPVPAGVLCWSGFLPTVPGWEPDVAGRPELRALIAGGMTVDYHETGAGHQIDPAVLPAAAEWLARTIPAAPVT